MRYVKRYMAVAPLLFMACWGVPHAGAASHVIVIGVDGMSPDGIQMAKTPHLDQLMEEGASTMHARAVMPTSSGPNWASMIMGAGPEQHGVTSNQWRPDAFELAPTVVQRGGIFPTIFGLLREQVPDALTACFYDWSGFGRLFAHADVTEVQDTDGPAATVSAAVAYIVEHRPAFTFIHLDHVDHAGHSRGHGTPEYYASVEEADEYIGEVIHGVKEAGIADSTAILVTSDHGGVGKGHGGATLAEVEIPWILSGPGVKKGKILERPVNTYDTAATAAYLLGVAPHPHWIAKPVLEAFE